MKKRSKAFTLVEVLSIIILLGIIVVIIIPISNSVVKSSKKKLYKEQVENILDASEKWVLVNENKVSMEADSVYYLTVLELKTFGLLKEKDIINPVTGEMMNGCTAIKYDVSYKQFKYEYNDPCNN